MRGNSINPVVDKMALVYTWKYYQLTKGETEAKALKYKASVGILTMSVCQKM